MSTKKHYHSIAIFLSPDSKTQVFAAGIKQSKKHAFCKEMFIEPKQQAHSSQLVGAIGLRHRLRKAEETTLSGL